APIAAPTPKLAPGEGPEEISWRTRMTAGSGTAGSSKARDSSVVAVQALMYITTRQIRYIMTISTITGPKTAPAGLPVAEEMMTVDSYLIASSAIAPNAAPLRPDFNGTLVRGSITIIHHITKKSASNPIARPAAKIIQFMPGKWSRPIQSNTFGMMPKVLAAVTPKAQIKAMSKPIRRSKSLIF